MKKQNDSKKDFWNDHSLTFLEMALKREYQERVENSDGFGEKRRSCGDTIRFYLMMEQGHISAISYDIKGCLYSHACANALIHLVRGKSLDEARTIDASHIIEYLETLPKEEHHCAEHAKAAFEAAMCNYESARR